MFSVLFKVKQGHCSLLKLTFHNCLLRQAIFSSKLYSSNHRIIIVQCGINKVHWGKHQVNSRYNAFH